MLFRSEVALIVTSAVIDTETLGEYALSPDFMIMTVLLILVSSILTPVLLKVLYGKDKPNALPPVDAPTAPPTSSAPAEPTEPNEPPAQTIEN